MVEKSVNKISPGDALLSVFYRVYMSSTPVQVSFDAFKSFFPNVAKKMLEKTHIDAEKVPNLCPNASVFITYTVKDNHFHAFFDPQSVKEYNILRQARMVSFHIPSRKLIKFALKVHI